MNFLFTAQLLIALAFGKISDFPMTNTTNWLPMHLPTKIKAGDVSLISVRLTEVLKFDVDLTTLETSIKAYDPDTSDSFVWIPPSILTAWVGTLTFKKPGFLWRGTLPKALFIEYRAKSYDRQRMYRRSHFITQ